MRRPGARRGIGVALALLVALDGAGGAVAQPTPTPNLTPNPNPTPKPAPTPTPATAEALFARLAALPGLRARYREEKRLPMLVAPVISEGVVYFVPPAQLIRVTTSPAWSSLALGPDGMSYVDEAGRQRVPLRRDHPARALVQVFVDVVRGDRGAIERGFVVRFAADAGGGWRLDLTPREAGFAGAGSAPGGRRSSRRLDSDGGAGIDPAGGRSSRRLDSDGGAGIDPGGGRSSRRLDSDGGVRSIAVRGRGVAIAELEVVDTAGDVTTTTFDGVVTDRRPAAAEVAAAQRPPRAPGR